jgi:ankyrin repeat protein
MHYKYFTKVNDLKITRKGLRAALRTDNSSPLHTAVDQVAITLPLEPGADLHCADKQGTALAPNASQWGEFGAVTCLFDHGTRINQRDDKGRTPLIEAIRNGHTDVLRLLLSEGADQEPFH